MYHVFGPLSSPREHCHGLETSRGPEKGVGLVIVTRFFGFALGLEDGVLVLKISTAAKDIFIKVVWFLTDNLEASGTGSVL